MAGASKLVVSIVHQADAQRTSDGLRDAGIRFTRIPSIGGFLEEPNQTFLMALDPDSVEHALRVISATTEAREVEVPLVLHDRLADWKARTVVHAGATSLIIDLERIVRT